MENLFVDIKKIKLRSGGKYNFSVGMTISRAFDLGIIKKVDNNVIITLPTEKDVSDFMAIMKSVFPGKHD